MFTEDRFGTRNTNFAACLGALKVPVKHLDPFTKIRDANTKVLSVYWAFEKQDASGLYNCIQLEKYWRDRTEFEHNFPAHPMIPMRIACEQLEWIHGVYFDRIQPEWRDEECGFETQNMELAAALRGCDYALLRWGGKKGFFEFGLIPPELLEHFDNCARYDTQIAYMGQVLAIRKQLMAAIRTMRDAPVMVEYRRGSGENVTICRIREGTEDSEESRKILREFYR